MTNITTNDLTTRAAKSVFIDLLKKEATSDSPFGRDFRAALFARDTAQVQKLTAEFADEVVRQYNAKKAER